MIQSGSFLNVIDNSGAKKLFCIKILNSGYKQRYGRIGCVVLASVKKVKFSKNIKVKKGELHKALIIKTNNITFSKSINYRRYFENAAILLNKKNKLLGTRIFDKIPKQLKYSKYLKILTLSAGISI